VDNVVGIEEMPRNGGVAPNPKIARVASVESSSKGNYERVKTERAKVSSWMNSTR
jgi:hypothetical protein